MSSYPVPAQVVKRGYIIAFHGGNFMGGSHTWDKDQNQALAQMGYQVYQPDFPKKYSQFLTWIKNHPPQSMIGNCKKELKDFDQLPVYCLGRSSGGYLARIYSHYWKKQVNKTLYICPVFQPLKRAEIMPNFAKLTYEFFDHPPPCMSFYKLNSQREKLLLAYKDENIPRAIFSPEQLDQAEYLGPESHKGMLTCRSKKFLDLVQRFFRSKQNFPEADLSKTQSPKKKKSRLE